jgi:ribonuclease H / adenosylcobalamin/alpha-ribazole phosphatase
VRTLIVEADGASRGNPGQASYGALVRDAGTGELLAELAAALGRATNNVAEYRGVIAGLEAAAAIDPAARLDVRMDSRLVVEQLSGRWQVKHPDLQPLAARARALFPAAGVTFTWIPRSENKHADRLANQALNAAAKGEVWESKTPLPAASQAAEASAPSLGQAPAAKARTGWGADLGRPTRLLLLRHGVTPLTGEKRFSGIGDPELIELGLEQARAAARRLAGPAGAGDPVYGPIDAVIASPLRRALRTAQEVAALAGLEAQVDAGFRELDFGGFEGLSFAEAGERYPAALAGFLGSVATPPPGGESVERAAARVARARDEVLARFERRTVLIVTHVTPIKALACQALGAPLEAVHRMELSAASLTVVDFYADGITNLRCLNDTAHLDGLR